MSEKVNEDGAIEKRCRSCRRNYWVDTKPFVNGWYNHFYCAGCCQFESMQRQHEDYMRQFEGY